MIYTKQDLKFWVDSDYKSYGMIHPFAARWTYGENWELFSYMRNLRKLEYYTNCKKTILSKILRFYYWFIHRRKCKYTNIYVAPNSVGPGFHIVHRGFRHILDGTIIGKNCTILPNVLIGKKRPDLLEWQIVIGDNCYIGTGVTILGPVVIGDNVTIAAGAVVISDIPSNSIVAGVPAKLVKMNVL